MSVYDLRHPLALSLFPVLDGKPERRAVRFQSGARGYVERYVHPYEDEPPNAYGWKPGDKQQEYVTGRVALGIVLVHRLDL